MYQRTGAPLVLGASMDLDFVLEAVSVSTGRDPAEIRREVVALVAKHWPEHVPVPYRTVIADSNDTVIAKTVDDGAGDRRSLTAVNNAAVEGRRVLGGDDCEGRRGVGCGAGGAGGCAGCDAGGRGGGLGLVGADCGRITALSVRHGVTLRDVVRAGLCYVEARGIPPRYEPGEAERAAAEAWDKADAAIDSACRQAVNAISNAVQILRSQARTVRP